jgi:hypothetical protein
MDIALSESGAQNLIGSQKKSLGEVSLNDNLQRKVLITSQRNPPKNTIEKINNLLPPPVALQLFGYPSGYTLPKDKEERKKRSANGQKNSMHITITSLQTPRWPISEERSW